MNYEYRIVKGTLKNNKTKNETSIKFGLIELKDGIFHFDIYLTDESFRDEYYENEVLVYSKHELIGITDKNEEIIAKGLFIESLSGEQNTRIRYRCRQWIEITSKSDKEGRNLTEDRKPNIRFVEVEGLNLFLSDHTEKKHFRQGVTLKRSMKYEFDHYTAALICNSIDQNTSIFNLEFFKCSNSDNLLIKFKFEKRNSLTLDSYYQIKKYFLSLLSFVNNGVVKIRRELYGAFAKEDQYDYISSSQDKIYSFKTLSKPRFNEYLAIHDRRKGSNDVLKKILLKSFDKFIEENLKLNLSNAIYNLVSAESVAIEERYYILITVLEKLATNLNNYNSLNHRNKVIDPEIFKEIKKDIFRTVDKHKDKINNQNDFEVIRSRIGNLNNINKNETKEKLKSLFQYSNVELTNDILSLIDNERNSAVHEGKFGNSVEEKYRNYYILDHSIRDIILNLIGYDGNKFKRI